MNRQPRVLIEPTRRASKAAIDGSCFRIQLTAPKTAFHFGYADIELGGHIDQTKVSIGGRLVWNSCTASVAP